MQPARYEVVEDAADRLLIRDLGDIVGNADQVVRELATRLAGRRLEYLDRCAKVHRILVLDGRFAGFGEGTDQLNCYRVAGAGFLAFEPNDISRTMDAVGLPISVSWGSHPYIGGVMDVREVRRLVDDLQAWLEEHGPAAVTWRNAQDGR